MRWVQWVRKISFYGGAISLSLLILVVLAAIIPRTDFRRTKVNCETTIYVSGDIIHASFLMPVQTETFNWQKHLNLIDTDSQFVSIGWGDHDFYLNTLSLQDLNLATAAKSLFWPTNTVIQVLSYDQLPSDTPGYRVRPVCVTQEEYQRLTTFLLNSFKTDQEGLKIRVSKPYRNKGYFYYAKGQYSAANTCNDWLAVGLRMANIKTPIWSGTALAIFHHLDQTYDHKGALATP